MANRPGQLAKAALRLLNHLNMNLAASCAMRANGQPVFHRGRFPLRIETEPVRQVKGRSVH